MANKLIAACVLLMLGGVSAQTWVFQKQVGSLDVKVTKTDTGQLRVHMTPTPSLPVLLPPMMDEVLDAAVWNNQRLVLTTMIRPLEMFAIVDIHSGTVVDSLLANFRSAVAPDARRVAFDLGRPLVLSQSAVVMLYDVSRPVLQNRVSGARPFLGGSVGGGLPVYPAWNRINQSEEIAPAGQPEHKLASQLVWLNNETLVFFAYSEGVLMAVLVDATDVSQPLVRTKAVDVLPLFTEAGKTLFPSRPLASLPYIQAVEPLFVSAGMVRLKATMRPEKWQATAEFEIEF